MQDLIKQNYEPVKVNLLLSIAYQMNGDSVMGEKYRATGNLMKMRELARVPNATEAKTEGNPKASQLIQQMKAFAPTQSQMTVEGGSESNEHQVTNEVDSIPGFKNVRLSPEEQDEVLISLAQFLLDNYLSEFAEQTLQNIDDKSSFKYLGCLARVRILQGKLGEELPLL